MRIGIEAQRLLRKNKHGIDIVALNLLRLIPVLDQDNEYVLFTRSGPDQELLSTLKNIKVVMLSAISYADWEQIRLPLAVKKEKIDLLHCTSSTAPLFSPVTTTITLHDIIFLERNAWGEKRQSIYQRFGNFYRRIVSTKAIASAASIATVSDFEREHITEHIPSVAHKITRIHNGVDREHFTHSSDHKTRAFRSRFGLREKYFLHLGNTDPKKNTELVIQAFIAYASEAAKVIPLVITDLDTYRVEELLRKYDGMHVRHHIHCVGYVSHAEMPHLYRSAKALLFPALRESFGMPMLEAMAAGVPVVAMEGSSLPEIAANAAFYIHSNDHHALADKMMFLQGPKKRYADITLLGMNRAEQFSWREAAFAYINFFRTVHYSMISAYRQKGSQSMKPVKNVFAVQY